MINNDKSSNLIDPFGRTVSYLRVSVTDRCDYRCVYCMSEDMTFLPKKDLLTLEELEVVCKTFVSMGVKKIRLTGGEPLVRKGIMQLINNLGSEVGHSLEELTITTNGSQLSKTVIHYQGSKVDSHFIFLNTWWERKTTVYQSRQGFGLYAFSLSFPPLIPSTSAG